METTNRHTLYACIAAGALTLAAGCQSDKCCKPAAAPAPVAAQPASPTATAAAPQAAQGILRIKAGVSAPFKDSAGNVWQADQGFDGGDVIDRDESTAISNTQDPKLYLSEHYGMNSFSCAVPNGKYLAKLHFAETFESISGPGQRVFTFKLHGHEFRDFDIFAKAGGVNRAYVESVPVVVNDGKFKIEFISNVENPEINAIELIPQS
jgi:hypothetical protein